MTYQLDIKISKNLLLTSASSDGLDVYLQVGKDVDRVAFGRSAAGASLGERVGRVEAVDRAGSDEQTKGQEEEDERQNAGGTHCESWRLDRADWIC
jgi:hypothetical protein